MIADDSPTLKWSSLHSKRRFVGEISGVNIWDTMFDADQIKDVYDNCPAVRILNNQ